MKKTLAVTATLAIAFGLSGLGAVAAFADDSTPDPVVTQTADPADTPAADPAPTVPTPPPAPDVTVQAPAPQALVVEPTQYRTVAWAMPSWIAATTPSWPQTFVAESAASATPDLGALDSQLTACGSQWQVDVYNDNATTAALVAGGHLDGPGNPAESLAPGGWGTAYKLIQGPACVTPPPAAIACVATPGFTTEDTAPVTTDAGLLFAGPSAAPIDTYQRVTAGNMQGLTGMSYTIPQASGYHVALVVEVNPNADLGAGTVHYATLTYEPYQNGAQPGATGTFDAQSGLWWTSKIANPNPGSQAQPISWAAMTALMPNNTLLSAPSLHLGSNSVAGQSSLVSAITSSCGDINFVTTPTPPTTPTAQLTPTPALAETGVTTDWLFPTAAALLLLGGAAVTIRRRLTRR